jgi:hypothetical protein
MKQSQRLEKKYNELNGQLIAEIRLLLKQHQDIEIEPEVNVFWATMDEESEPQIIQEVYVDVVTIFHHGDAIQSVSLEHLHTSTLIEVLKGMEKSLEEAKKFISK